MFARSLSTPKRFEQRKVAPIENEVQRDEDGENPLPQQIHPVRDRADKDSPKQADDKEYTTHDQVIDQDSDKPAADTRHRKLEFHLLGRVDVKLVGKAALLKCSHDHEPLDRSSQG